MIEWMTAVTRQWSLATAIKRVVKESAFSLEHLKMMLGWLENVAVIARENNQCYDAAALTVTTPDIPGLTIGRRNNDDRR